MSNNDEWGAYSGEDDNAVEIKDFGDFDSVDSAINLDMEEPIHKAQNQSVSTRNTDEDEKEIKDTNKYIKIEIDSIDKLIGLLKFHSTNFEAAMDRVASNKDLSSILSELQKIKTVDISKFSSKLEQAVENSNAKLTETINKIDLSQIEKKIDKKFDENISKNIKELEKASEKFATWGKEFKDPDIFEIVDKINEFEKFITKEFKFKSIIFLSLVGFFAAAIVGYYTGQMLVDSKCKQVVENADILSPKFGQITAYPHQKDPNIFYIGFEKSKLKSKIESFEQGDTRYILIEAVQK